MALEAQEKIDEVLTDFQFISARMLSTKEYTLAVIDAMPEEHYDFQPTEEVMSNRALALHIVRSIEWNHAVMKGSPIKWTDGDHKSFSKSELLAYGEREFDAWIAFVHKSKLTASLGDKVVDVLNHNAHHRGQMVTYLRLKGIKPPPYR